MPSPVHALPATHTRRPFRTCATPLCRPHLMSSCGPVCSSRQVRRGVSEFVRPSSGSQRPRGSDSGRRGHSSSSAAGSAKTSWCARSSARRRCQSCEKISLCQTGHIYLMTVYHPIRWSPSDGMIYRHIYLMTVYHPIRWGPPVLKTYQTSVLESCAGYTR